MRRTDKSSTPRTSTTPALCRVIDAAGNRCTQSEREPDGPCARHAGQLQVAERVAQERRTPFAPGETFKLDFNRDSDNPTATVFVIGHHDHQVHFAHLAPPAQSNGHARPPQPERHSQRSDRRHEQRPAAARQPSSGRGSSDLRAIFYNRNPMGSRRD